ncbi:MAG TPA: tRNA epoxyqueuosine(34) reductase QueG [Polyangiaceae bacterium]|nr:tRNA epoxyqueuosine(34) reductase QueG [Polyangiaceae bacterium]
MVARPRAAPRDDRADGVKLHHPTGRYPQIGIPIPRERLDSIARELGLPLIGLTDAEPLDAQRGPLLAWLQSGQAGIMDYLLDGGTATDSPRVTPRAILPEARAVIVAALAYPPGSSTGSAAASAAGTPENAAGTDERLRGVVAAYARGNDYHHVLKDRLLLLADAIADLQGRPVLARACVDTAPLLERALAVRAGLGFVAKNTMVIAPGQGSYFVLGELLIDADLEPPPIAAPFDGCGRCRLCLDACPTQAFPDAYQLDARRCVSYLTIELSGDIPRELRSGVGPRVFGCDECQSVCPYNRTAHKKPNDPEFAPRESLDLPELEALLFLGSARYRSLVRGSALKRTHRAQLARNAAIALGNSGDPRAVALLRRAVEEHPIELARSHAAWALGRLAVDFSLEEARAALDAQAEHADDSVRAEREAWLGAAV